MKSLGFYLGYIKGYFTGYISGKQAGKWFVKAVAEYKGIENIPTREIQKKMGASADMIVARQRLKLAAVALRHLSESYVNHALPNTMDAVCDFLDFKQPMDERIEAISRSKAVVHALAFYAEDVDQLSIANLREALDKKGDGHFWHLFDDNRMLIVH